MSLLITMLPLYLFGNLHCVGMCGPLVMMIGMHRFRYFYFLGRTFSFTLAGMLAGGLGSVLHLALKSLHVMEVISFLFGGIICLIGLYTLQGWQYPGFNWLAKKLAPFNATLSTLMLQDKIWPTFFFGFFTILLPCGQTLIVFSACALSGSLLTGLLNGFIFALLTSPSLIVAMHASSFLKEFKKHYRLLMGGGAFFTGGLMICRGLAEIGMIEHLSFQSHLFHLVLY